MKQLIVLLIAVLFLMGTVSAVAQGPIGTPLAPPPGSGGPGQPLAPAPTIGTLIPKAPDQYQPTWQVPPTPLPTAVSWNWYDVIALEPVPVRMCPADACYVLTTLPTGTVVTVRWAGPGWLQLESGYAIGSYIRDDYRVQRV